MRVVLLGSGNVATVLGKLIAASEHNVVQVYSRHEQHAAHLAKLLHCSFTSDTQDISTDADLYILSVADSAVPQLASSIQLGRKLIVHTAGSVPGDVLKVSSKNFGVLYPLQTLKKDIDIIPNIPLLIDSNTPDNLALLEDFARQLTPFVYKVTDEQREALHVAAVTVSNFTNHLYTMAADYCSSRALDFKMLLPLIEESAHRLYSANPQEVQTGPAIRSDRATIDKHLQALQHFPVLQRFYSMFSEEIQKYYDQQKSKEADR